MKKLLLLGALMTMSSFAAIITYSTTGSQVCIGSQGCGVATQTIGGSTGVRITFNPIASSTVNANPTTFGSFGEVIIACVGGGTACGSQSLAGANLYLNITQTLPAPGGVANISGGVMAGSISGTASSASITWSVPNDVFIGGANGISYSVLNNPLGLVPPSVNSGFTSIQATITDNATGPSPVPEPSTYVMVSAAIVGLGLLRKRASK
ncbi:MAG: PEP-CTERM sorting domain-containing protein [Acidobacteria bacterium]|jgi:hypothetical protein|nr:PEP-CTERM sorting domain-containing protein [Bryobacteraceae bacterium CoA2 C42]